jgi:hypothetical protein
MSASLIPLVLKHWKAGIAVFLVAAVMGYVVTLQRQIAALTRVIEGQKTEMAQMRQAMQKLADAAAVLKPGERVVEYIPRPQYIPYPVAGPPGPLRVEYIREPGRIETRVETIRLPAEQIEKVIDRSPQTIIAEFTATRDIAKGEKFRLVAAQISPGVYQPILDLGAPVTVEVRTATPVDKIPAPTPAFVRWSGRLYGGYGTTDHALTGLRVNYRLDRRWDVEGQGECRQMFTKDPADPTKTRICGGTDYRITAGLRF